MGKHYDSFPVELRHLDRLWYRGGRLYASCGSIDAMNKRKSSRITGVFVILFGFMPLLNSLSNPRLASAHGSDRLQVIAVGLCFGIGACLLAGLFRFPGK